MTKSNEMVRMEAENKKFNLDMKSKMITLLLKDGYSFNDSSKSIIPAGSVVLSKKGNTPYIVDAACKSSLGLLFDMKKLERESVIDTKGKYSKITQSNNSVLSDMGGIEYSLNALRQEITSDLVLEFDKRRDCKIQTADMMFMRENMRPNEKDSPIVSNVREILSEAFNAELEIEVAEKPLSLDLGMADHELGAYCAD